MTSKITDTAGFFGARMRLAGIPSASKAFLLAELARGVALESVLAGFPQATCAPSSAPLVIVVPGSVELERLRDDLSFYLGRKAPSSSVAAQQILRFPAWDVLPFDALSPSREISALRLHALSSLVRGAGDIVILSADALCQRLASPETVRDAAFSLVLSAPLDRESLVERLDRIGYERCSLVEECGQFAVRGAVVDLFTAGLDGPLRIELFDDRIQSLRLFDAATQRSTVSLQQVDVLPVSELLLNADSGNKPSHGGKLRARASELEIPISRVVEAEEALESGFHWPGLEHLRPLLTEELSAFEEFLPPDTRLVIWDELGVEQALLAYETLVHERAERAAAESRLFPPIERAYLDSRRVSAMLADRANLVFGTIDQPDEGISGSFSAEHLRKTLRTNEELTLSLKQMLYSDTPFKPLADDLEKRRAQGDALAVVVSHAARADRLQGILGHYGFSVRLYESGFPEWMDYADSGAEARCELFAIKGTLHAGVRHLRRRISVIAESEIFPDLSPRRRSPGASTVRRFVGAITQLKEHDYVVHQEHGVAIYRGLREIEVEGKIGDFLHLEYAEEARLFVPVDQIGRVKKYLGAEGKKPALSKLGSRQWAKTKQKVQENVAQLAGQLVNLYAERELTSGFSFGAPDTEDLAFADRFPFEETPDQAQAINEVLADMARSRPMERLVCGDVGYGKTEVALRAAFKAVNCGKQVAVIVPTTVLADQHFATFRERFADLPVNIACVSRFFSSQENRAALADVAAGKVDIVIGTHRLLQRDVVFRDLGLLVIDEEHRFGVAQKERLKRFRHDLDVLTLTATPIPRTLHMSLINIRDLSVIATPPTDRHSIRTFLATYDATLVREAVLREIGRGGQVFYIFNRVQGIETVAAELRKLVPEARVSFAHGQMKQTELESIMHRFVKGEIDVLVSTTIVESGLDIPNANTLIVRNADRFGLAELYQLRGRVGRSSRRASAYLLIADPKRIGADARKRLEVLQALDDLGQGFRLALQDMEIRGAGNLLGKDQSGQVNMVGFDLYSKIMEQAVRELKARDRREDGSCPKPEFDPEIRIGFPAHIPSFFIPDVADRLLLYQRLVELKDDRTAWEIAEEVEDRYGRPPPEVHLLFELMSLRGFLRARGIESLAYRDGILRFRFHPDCAPEPGPVLSSIKALHGRVKLSPSGVLSAEVDDQMTCPADVERALKYTLRTILGESWSMGVSNCSSS